MEADTYCHRIMMLKQDLKLGALRVVNHLKRNLYEAKQAFEKNEIPVVIKILEYKLWDSFKKSVDMQCDFKKCHGVPLITRGYRGRVTRSGSKYGYDKEAFSALVKSRYPKYAKFLKDILEKLEK